jgi:hypothetical protein
MRKKVILRVAPIEILGLKRVPFLPPLLFLRYEREGEAALLPLPHLSNAGSGHYFPWSSSVNYECCLRCLTSGGGEEYGTSFPSRSGEIPAKTVTLSIPNSPIGVDRRVKTFANTFPGRFYQ